MSSDDSALALTGIALLLRKRFRRTAEISGAGAANTAKDPKRTSAAEQAPRYPARRQKHVDQMGSRTRRVTAIAGLFYVALIVGNGAVASWYASVHDMPWVAIGVGLLAVVALVMTVRIIRSQYTSERDG
jgi:hypothetical protein